LCTTKKPGASRVILFSTGSTEKTRDEQDGGFTFLMVIAAVRIAGCTKLWQWKWTGDGMIKKSWRDRLLHPNR
jgi:hypothetical protein